MSKPAKRSFLGFHRGYLSAAGPQSRFIIFLVFVLIAFTLLLRVFQKLAEILQLPVFLPVSLVTLLVFIGVVGTIYSHAFVGPMVRIRRAVDQLTKGDITIFLKLRDSDDPMLKELVDSLNRLCDHNKNIYALVKDSVQELSHEMQALEESIDKDADKNEVRTHLETVRKSGDSLEKAVHSFRKL